MNKFNKKYCVNCEQNVFVECDQGYHLVYVFLDEDVVCFGPFTSCPPPDNFDDDFDLNVVEPSPEELAEMDLQAEVLLQELEG